MSDVLTKFIEEETKKEEENGKFLEDSQRFLEDSQRFLNSSKRKPIRKEFDSFSYLLSLQNLPS